MKNSDKIILDLMAGTGAFSEPYVQAGYDVRRITWPDADVRTYIPPRKSVYGIIMAVDCTHYSGSGARWWKDKDNDGRTLMAVLSTKCCLEIKDYYVKRGGLVFWVLENPAGRIRKLIPELGKWKMTFQPHEYGDPWTKRTCLWGDFNIPEKHPVNICPSKQYLSGSPSKEMCYKRLLPSWTGGSENTDKRIGVVDHLDELPPDWIHHLPPSADRATLRAITPPGFAKAFFEANQ